MIINNLIEIASTLGMCDNHDNEIIMKDIAAHMQYTTNMLLSNHHRG